MSLTTSALRVLALLALAFALAPFVRGQGSTPPQGRPARPDPVQREMQRQLDMLMIEKALADGHRRPVQRYAPLVLEEIRADFLRIQIVDRQLARAGSVPDRLDLGFIARSMGEIRKRTSRLKRNLELPKGSPVDQTRLAVEPKIESLRSSLSGLSNLIEEFVSNPIFEAAKLADAPLSAKARRDLEAIIELSGEIKRSSEKLKGAAKSR